jgi:hypothetical protein
VNIFKKNLFLIFICFSYASVQSMQRSTKFLKEFSPTQINKFIPWLAAHQKTTNDCLEKLAPKEDQRFEKLTNPEVIFPYLVLCQTLKAKPLPTLYCSRPIPPIFLKKNNNNFHYIAVSFSFENLPYSVQYFELLKFIHMSTYHPPISKNLISQISQQTIKKVLCPVCLSMQAFLNEDDTFKKSFISQTSKAVHPCPTHAAHCTKNLEQNLQQLHQIKETIGHPEHYERAWERISKTVTEDNSMGSILDRIPPHLFPENFI